jgi:LysM repeat protein
MSTRKRTSVLVLVMLLIGSVLPLSQVLAATTTALLTPSYQTIAVDQSVPVTLRLENVDSLYGFQVEITFDPAIVQVVDADPGKTGVQVSLGSFLQPDFVPQNEADNATGKIVCVVSQLAPTAAVSGTGNLFTATFKGKADGLTNLVFADIKLAKSDGTAIAVTVQNAQIQVGSPGAQTPTPTSTPTSTPTPTATVPGTTPTATSPVPTSTPTPTATPVPGGTVIHVVRTGDTLYSLARRYGTTVQAIAQVNGIANTSYIRVGQQLTIPRPGSVTPVPPTPGPSPTTYVVQRGDTLYSIARRYGTSVQAIAVANHIANPSLIYAGQRLAIPGSGTAPTPPPYTRVHTVQPGETLYSIARRYGTTYWAISVANNLVNPNIIYAGQRLVIP